MVDFVHVAGVRADAADAAEARAGVAPQERYLLAPMQRLARFSIRHAQAGAGRHARADGAVGRRASRGCASTPTTSTSSPRIIRCTSRPTVIDEQLSGIYSFNILLEGAPDSMKSPDALRRMEELRVRLETAAVRPQGGVGGRLRQAREPRAERRRRGARRSCPASAEAIAQELFVFGLSDDGRRELERVVASDYSRAQISVKLASMSSDLVFEQINRAEERGGGGVRRQRHHADGRPGPAGSSPRSTTTSSCRS